LSFLETNIEFLKGVGPTRAELLQKELGIFKFKHLVQHYPFRYIDRSKFYKIAEVNAELPNIQVIGRLGNVEELGKPRSKRLRAEFYDDTGVLELVWFKGVKWIKGSLKPGVTYVLFGKPSVFNGKLNVAHPDLEPLSKANAHTKSALQPVYNTTEKLNSRGLNSKGIEKLQKVLIPQLKGKVKETLSPEVIEDYRLMSRDEAIQQIHFPEDVKALQRAQLRLKFEELFFIQLQILRMKLYRQQATKGFVFEQVGEHFNTFYSNHIPFELTNAQKRVIKEIRKDLRVGQQMNRLLQGDVGSGKTMVSLLVMLLAIDNGYQAALMAPTEILATQHFETIEEQLRDMNLNVALLTGSTKTAERKELHEKLLSGELNILIGTHALLEDKVKFQNLGLVVIDEQHRFGVAQRSKMWKKNTLPPHVLVMSATPIPRTLAMTLYGDLDVSVIDELPPGRKPIQTNHFFERSRLKVFGFIKNEIQKGRQVYVVYPLIEESETLDLKNLDEGYESIKRAFPEFQVSVVHGRMKAADKDFEMNRFVKGETQIMVATTVIEVGVNVPNASVMVIENAERFGLSQLHQLRGRVGRGAEQSYCVLMTGEKLSKEARTRMETMVRTNDGFEVAEEDLKLRGPGDLMGTQQSGALNLQLADLAKDDQILQLARNAAAQILKVDPNLEFPAHQNIKEAFTRFMKSRPNWSRIS
tara:strand:+ start:676 stop:2769 length:2094 start_codon:yes stop_codon:yes gene_type:complete